MKLSTILQAKQLNALIWTYFILKCFDVNMNVIVNTELYVSPLFDELSSPWYQSYVCTCMNAYRAINETVFTNKSIAVNTVFFR